MSRVSEKILVIDDDGANLTLIDGILSDLYRVYPIASGADALEFLEVQRPDLILLDVQMPEMSGIELYRILKSDPKLSDIPVIFLTGLDDAKSEAEIFRMGASDFIRKPINDVVLQSKLKTHLELAAYHRLLKSFRSAARRSILYRRKREL